MDGAVLIGRVMLAAMFIFSGANKLMDPGMTAQMLAGKGLPSPEMLAYAVGAFEVAAGVAVAIGFQTILAAIGLAVFTVAASVLYHDFWNFTGQEATMQMQNFMKNIAITGGFLVLAVHGPGRYSLGHGHTIRAKPGQLGMA